MIRRSISLVLLLLTWINSTGQTTIGLIDRQPDSEDGYVLFAPSSSDTTYLIDKCGRKVHQWVSTYAPGQSVYLLPDGTLVRTGRVNNSVFTAGGTGGIIERYDWNGQLLWSFAVSSATECQHHDIFPMSNGHILVLAWDLKTRAEAIAAGRDPSRLGNALWSEKIIELEPVGMSGANIVWEWNVWDHLVQSFDATKPDYGIPSQHPQLINLNFTSGAVTNADWLHCNALDYNEELDQIMISNHNFCELWIIDHGTTVQEAAGHSGGQYGKGGDLLYRWGNPQAYGRGTSADKKFFGQHNTQWIRNGLTDAGNILVFNNGLNRPGGSFSTVEILSPEIDSAGNYPVPATTGFGPDSAYWKYSAPVPTDFYSPNISGAQRLSSGNTLVCSGSDGEFFEITPAGAAVWKYISPTTQGGVLMSQGANPAMNSVFRCTQYSATYDAFSGQSLVPGNPVEANPLPNGCDMSTSVSETSSADFQLSLDGYRRALVLHWRKPSATASIFMHDMQGRNVSAWNAVTNHEEETILPLPDIIRSGCYIVEVHSSHTSGYRRVFLSY